MAKAPSIGELVSTLKSLKSETELEKFLRELLTERELTEFANRLQIIRMIEHGIPPREIAKKLNVGIATVSRGAKVVKLTKG